MADIGRAALTIVGFAVGGPWGALIGGLVGSLLFPPEDVEGPRLNELNFQRSTVGAPIPIVYGTSALAGNVIWSSGLVETKHEDEQGGFFGIGGTTVTSYSYAVDLAIGICEGEIGAVRRIWADADLIFDARTDEEIAADPTFESIDDLPEFLASLRAMSAALEFVFYPGSETQLPDPTIESYEGAGNVPGYRGLSYIVFSNFQLAKYGNRIPNFRFEVSSTGTETECGLYTGGQLAPWQFYIDPSVTDPRNPANNHLYGYTELGGITNTTFAAAMADLNAASDHTPQPFTYGETPQQGDSLYAHGWSTSTTPNQIAPCETTGSAQILDYVGVQVTLNVSRNYLGADDACSFEVGGNTCADWLAFVGVGGARYVSSGQFSGIVAVAPLSTYPSSDFGGVPQSSGDVVLFLSNCNVAGETFNVWRLQSHELGVRRTIEPLPRWNLTYTLVSSGTFKVLQKYEEGNAGFRPGRVISYPYDPCLRSDDPNYNDQAYWEAAYADALAAGAIINSEDGAIPGSWVYGVDYPTVISAGSTSVWRADCIAVEVECVPMSVIVTDICQRAGLTPGQIDVTDLTTCVDGYIIGRQMTARDALMPLRRFGLWDGFESGAVLKFVERGHALVATLTDDDLGVHEHGSTPPTKLETTRVQEKELPRRVRVHFANNLRDHEVSEQDASRTTTEAVDEVDVPLPISMTPDTAAQLADIFLYEAWVARNSYAFQLDNAWLALEPSDCVEIPVDGETQRVRIVSIDYSIGGILKVAAVRDDDGSYTSTAIPDTGSPSGGGPFAPGAGPICPTEAVFLDLPRLNESHTDCGFYVALYGVCDSWACAELYRSSDGGVSYGRVARTDRQATVGTLDALTGVGAASEYPDYDTTNVLTVTLANGTLASVTDAQIQAGQNMAAVGVDGGWAIIQFKTAVFTTGETWELSDLLWGLNGTGANLTGIGAGDTFVLLSSDALLRIPETFANLGVSKSFKALTCGQTLDDVDAVSFATQCLSYKVPIVSEEPPEPVDTSTVETNPDCARVLQWDEETAQYLGLPLRLGEACDLEIDSSTAIGDHLVIVGVDSSGFIYGFEPGPDSSDTSGGADALATYLTEQDETASLPNSFRLVAGDNIEFETDTSGNTLIIHASDTIGSIGTGGWTYTEQNTDQDFVNNTFTDTELAANLEAGTYSYRMVIFTETNSVSDAKRRLHYTGTVTKLVNMTRSVTSTGATGQAVETAIDTSGSFTTTSTNGSDWNGTLTVSDAGTFSYQFAQVTTSAGNPVRVLKGSYMEIRKIA